MQRTQAFRQHGCSSVIHYAVNWLGCTPDDAYSIRSVAEKLEHLPLLTAAAEAGRVGWCHLKAVLRRATPENEEIWLEEAQSSSMKRLEWLLRNDGSAEARREAELARFEFTVAPEVGMMYQRAVRVICHREGGRVAAAEIFEYILAEFLAGAEDCTPDQAREDARRDLETPWEAVEVQETPCPGNSGVTLASKPSRIKFNPQARHVTEAQKTLLMRRDRYRCITPGCPNNLWLHMHHIVFYCEGGATVPETLVTVCSACHANIHEGNLVVTGFPPDRLDWTTADGRGVGATQFVEPALWADSWLDGS